MEDLRTGCRFHAEPFALLYLSTYLRPMKTTSFSELRKTLAATIDRVTADHEPVLITRDRGRPAAVLMSIEDFASYQETRYLLQNPANADRLIEATRRLDRGEGRERDLID